MPIGPISLLVLIIAILTAFNRRVNTGLVSIAFAFLLGFFVMSDGSDMSLSSPEARGRALVAGFNTRLFFILMGVTFLFSIAKVNGTLELVARKAAALARGNQKLIPILFFGLSAILSAIGPGNISVCALVLPITLAVAHEEKINPLLMATLVISGANAGGLSPIAPTGIIGVQLSADIGFDVAGHVFLNMFIGQTALATVCYFALGGWKLKRRGDTQNRTTSAFDTKQKQTIAGVLLVIIAIIVFKLHIGLTAFLGGALLLLLHCAEDRRTIAAMPWDALLLVTGVGVLVNVVSLAGGITYLTDILATVMSPGTAASIITLIAGLMSTVSSASGVVLPTLIPTVPGILTSMNDEISGASIISAIILGAHFVTISPFSTLGALALASLPETEDRDRLFKGLIIVGFGGVLFGAVLVFSGVVR